MTLSIEDMATFCKKKGLVYPSSEIYGGMAGFFDYGPYGSELKKNIKDSWWKHFVQSREDIVGIDGSIITNPKVWEASGHVANFKDIMLDCSKCGEKVRADVFLEEKLNIAADGWKADKINEEIEKNNFVCPKCKGLFKKAEDFNLMFSTNVGPKKDDSSTAYLRPETAQVMFADFKDIVTNARLKLPFGIAQMGKAFRNEISPRNFLFRCREFEQLEIEFFIHPKKADECPFDISETEVNIYSAKMQDENQEMKVMKIKDALKKGIIIKSWHAYWLDQSLQFFIKNSCNINNFRLRQHISTERAHYSTDCWDLEYKFPFGWKELQGIADRGQYDLKQHMEHSKKDLSLYDEESKEKVVPMVICEPSLGLDRTFLVFMYEAYNEDEKRGNTVLKFDSKLAPIKVGVFPLVNKLKDKARKIYDSLKEDFVCQYDTSGSVGRRYARADEIGIPYCITVDFEDDNKVTVRDRDSTKQERVSIDELKGYLLQKL